MKVVMLIPCLMLENNRKANHESLRYAKENYAVDEIVIDDQCFAETDYEEGFTYIGHHADRAGFVNTRNELLKWFYESDYDYAVWLDANSRVSEPSLNDFDTLLKAAKAGEVKVDAILSTLGIIVSGARIAAKTMKDYKEKIYLVKVGNECDWFHGMLMKNIKKAYGEELYIDPEAEPRKAGMTEDVFFVRLFRKLYDVRQCPTITVTKSGVKTSTWAASDTGKYNYPKNKYDIVENAIRGYIKKNGLVARKQTLETYSYDRTDFKKDKLKEYRPRPKKVKTSLI